MNTRTNKRETNKMAVQVAPVKQPESVGHVWHNRLYSGNNLDVLRALQEDTAIKGNVRLV